MATDPDDEAHHPQARDEILLEVDAPGAAPSVQQRVEQSAHAVIVEAEPLEHEISEERVRADAGFDALRAWFQKHARGWDEVEDIEGELDRG